MIEGAEAIYREIAESMPGAISEPWTEAHFHAIFYPRSSIYEGEYIQKQGGALRDFETSSEGSRAFRRLREMFKAAGQPLWGQAHFTLQADGKFKMDFGYEGLDADGNTKFDEKHEAKRHEARLKRLGFS